jgi:hypothetical protein
MTYSEHLTQMTRALVDVARHGQQDLTDSELDIALLARRDVLELLTTVHADLTGIASSRKVISIDDLEAHPVAALGRALARHPRPPSERAPSDAFVLPATTVAGQAWREVARHALVAHYHWSAGAGPRGDLATVWAGVADLAAVSRQLAVLDVELADTLYAAGPHRRATAQALSCGATSGLGVAARETARLAGTGPITDTGPDRGAQLAPKPRILVARSGTDLPATQHLLTAFLDGASNVRPERLPHLATAIARCALIVRDHLSADDPIATPLRGELREHARLLQAATARPGGLVSLEPGDLRPLRQAAEAYQGACRHGAALASDRRLLADYLGALTASTQALSAAVDRSIAGRRWLVPDVSDSIERPAWRALRLSAPAPHPVLAVRAAAAHADVVRQAAMKWLTPSAPARVRAVLGLASARGHAGAEATAPRDLVGDVAVPRPQVPSRPVWSRTSTSRR